MVFVKVRETYDLHTVQNKMTVISVHTPRPDIIKRNYPGLLMQCRAYRPVSCDVRIACASTMPLDPLGVGTAVGDVAPEDVFNPILYKAMSNKGMSQLEARISQMSSQLNISGLDVQGQTANVDVDSNTDRADEFNVYYGLLSNTHDWKHANPQSGLSMTDLRPFVYELVYNVGDQLACATNNGTLDTRSIQADGQRTTFSPQAVLGNAKEFPFLNCTSYSYLKTGDVPTAGTYAEPGFPSTNSFTTVSNLSVDIPYLPVCVAGLVIPPSRRHELFYRMVVVWTLEFTSVRPLSEVTSWGGLDQIGASTHYQNYSYSATKEALTGTSDTILSNDTCMVSANVDVNKVM